MGLVAVALRLLELAVQGLFDRVGEFQRVERGQVVGAPRLGGELVGQHVVVIAKRILAGEADSLGPRPDPALRPWLELSLKAERAFGFSWS